MRLESEKLIEARFVMEVEYLEWLATPVHIMKSNGKCRIYIDFTDFN